ncbi:MAG: response regulator transcription factor [Bacilli bacterium]|jgi:two-component system response regulator VanR|nr:response regulator transcription factor [Bacilli bacterium]
MRKVIYIDDDTEFGKLFSEFLERNGFDIDFCSDIHETLDKVKNNNYDLIIIDFFLKDFNGVQFAELINQIKPNLKIIILSNSTTINDEIEALSSNIIDEFIKKEDTLNVILARIRKVMNLRNKKESSNHNKVVYSNLENLKVDIENRIVTKNNKLIQLSFLEFDLLITFLKNPNVCLSRQELLNKVWKLENSNNYTDTRTIDVHVMKLRKKLNVNCIKSIRGYGYCWYEKE